MRISKEMKKELVASFLYDQKSYEELSSEYHIPIIWLKWYVIRFTNEVVNERRLSCNTLECLYEEVQESYEDMSVEELVGSVEYLDHIEQDTVNNDMDDNESKQKESTSSELYYYSLASSECFPELLKYKAAKVTEIVVLFLEGEYTIRELAKIHEVSQYVVFAWIIVYYYDAEAIIAKRKAKMKLGKVSQYAYTKKFKHVICTIYRMGLSSVDIERFFNISTSSVRHWNEKFEENDNEFADLDTIVDDYFVRKRAIEIFDENKKLNEAMKILLNKRSKETKYEKKA